MAVDGNGNVYVVDDGNHRIQVFTSSGDFITQWGSLGTGDGQFQLPNGVALDATGNIYYVVDQNNHRVQKFGPLQTPTRATSWGRLKTHYR